MNSVTFPCPHPLKKKLHSCCWKFLTGFLYKLKITSRIQKVRPPQEVRNKLYNLFFLSPHQTVLLLQDELPRIPDPPAADFNPLNLICLGYVFAGKFVKNDKSDSNGDLFTYVKSPCDSDLSFLMDFPAYVIFFLQVRSSSMSERPV